MTCRHNWTSFLLVGRAHWLIFFFFFFLLIQSVAFTSCCCWTRATAFCRQHTAISHVNSPVRVIEIWILPFFLPPPILLLTWKYCCFYILRSRSDSFCIQICSTIHFSFVPRALRPGVSRRMVGCKFPNLGLYRIAQWQSGRMTFPSLYIASSYSFLSTANRRCQYPSENVIRSNVGKGRRGIRMLNNKNSEVVS